MVRPYGAARSVVVAALTGLAASACGGSSQATPMRVPPQGVTVDLRDRTYEIRGDDAPTLRDQMRTLGPRPFYGRFDWRIYTRYRYGPVENSSINPGASRETRCELKNVEISLELSITMPRWEPPPSASEELVAQWAEFERALRVHEEGHRDLALRAADEVRRRFRDLRLSNCAFMRREVDQLQESIVEKWQERSREYDEETGHGRTQGAVWPPANGRGTSVSAH